MAFYSKCLGKPWKGTKQRNDSLFLQNEVFYVLIEITFFNIITTYIT